MTTQPRSAANTEPIEQPLFLVSAERSGSTLLRLMLDHHPQIAFDHEFDLAVALVSDAGDFPAINVFLDWLETVRGFDYAIDASLSYLELVNSFLRQKWSASGFKPWIGATAHHHFHRFPYLWPNARFIHLIRDPRDVAQSVVDKGWAGNLFVGAQVWREAEDCWDRLTSQLRPGQAVEVRYEDLVQNPTKEVTRICHFIGVDFDEAMFRYTDSAPQYPPPDASLREQWTQRTSPRQIRQVEAQVADLMHRRGYAPHDPHASISRLGQMLLTFESRVKCFQHRVRTFGLDLVLRDNLARRLGSHAWQRQLRQQINELETKRIRMEAAGFTAPSANLRPVREPHIIAAKTHKARNQTLPTDDDQRS